MIAIIVSNVKTAPIPKYKMFIIVCAVQVLFFITIMIVVQNNTIAAKNDIIKVKIEIFVNVIAAFFEVYHPIKETIKHIIAPIPNTYTINCAENKLTTIENPTD